MGVKRIDPERAKELLEQSSGYTFVDVRTEREFDDGHVPGAKNAPFFVRGPRGAGLEENAQFVDIIRDNFGLDAKLIIGCQKGGRSNKACQVLAAEGYTNLHDMRGGFVGETDPFGKVLFPGWINRGYPSTTDSTKSDFLAPKTVSS